MSLVNLIILKSCNASLSKAIITQGYVILLSNSVFDSKIVLVLMGESGQKRFCTSSFQSLHIMCRIFWNGSSLLRMNQSHSLIHAQNLDALITRIMSIAQGWFHDNCPSPSVLEGDGITIFPIAIDVTVKFARSMDFVDLLETRSQEQYGGVYEKD